MSVNAARKSACVTAGELTYSRRQLIHFGPCSAAIDGLGRNRGAFRKCGCPSRRHRRRAGIRDYDIAPML